MGTFLATCAITRTPIHEGTRVVCVRIDRKHDAPPFRDWYDPNRDSVVRAIHGVWFGKYDGAGSVTGIPTAQETRPPEPGEEFFRFVALSKGEAPPAPEPFDRFRDADILILRTAWDAIVRRGRKRQAKLRATTPYDHVTAFVRGYTESLDFHTRMARDMTEENAWAYLTDIGINAWPWWLDALGHVVWFARWARIDMLGSVRNSAQDPALPEARFLRAIERRELAKFERHDRARCR